MNGFTPLHNAVFQTQVHNVQLLLSWNADCNKQARILQDWNADNQPEHRLCTPLALAERCKDTNAMSEMMTEEKKRDDDQKYTQIISILKKAGARE